MSYFHLGADAEPDIEIIHHSLALDGPCVSPDEIISVANMAKGMDRNSYFRACADNIYVHWTTKQPIAA